MKAATGWIIGGVAAAAGIAAAAVGVALSRRPRTPLVVTAPPVIAPSAAAQVPAQPPPPAPPPSPPAGPSNPLHDFTGLIQAGADLVSNVNGFIASLG